MDAVIQDASPKFLGTRLSLAEVLDSNNWILINPSWILTIPRNLGTRLRGSVKFMELSSGKVYIS